MLPIACRARIPSSRRADRFQWPLRWSRLTMSIPSAVRRSGINAASPGNKLHGHVWGASRRPFRGLRDGLDMLWP